MMKLRYLGAWFVLLALAMVNGALRELTYGKHVSELLAHQLSCVSGIFLFAVVIRLFVRRWPPASAREAIYIRLFWMALTAAFESLFFHYVTGHPREVLLANYDMASGRMWPLVLLWVTVAPWLFFAVRRPHQPA